MPRRPARDELPFLRASDAARHGKAARVAYMLSYSVLALLIGALFWFHTAEIREVTRARGSVVPAQQVQVVQNLEGGVLKVLHVTEGQTVKAGDPIATLDATIAESSLDELRAELDAKRAALVRLHAEVTGAPPAFPADLSAQAPEIVRDQRDLYRARRADLNTQVDSLVSQAKQRAQEIAELQDRRDQLASRLSLAREELAQSLPLAERNLVPRTKILSLRRDVARLTGEFETVRDSIPRARTAADQARQRVVEARLTFRRDAADDLTKALTERTVLETRIGERRDQADRRVVTAPVDGRVKQIHTNTLGAAIKPGADIAALVPTGESLLIEARVPPNDIAFIAEGQPALVKITAYDYAQYGGLDGTVETVSAGTERLPDGGSFYRVHVRTDRTTLAAETGNLPILPGMTAEVELLGGTKTVLDYLTTPLAQGRAHAETPNGAGVRPPAGRDDTPG